MTNLWLIMVAIGLITFGTRLSFIFLLGRISVPSLLQRALRYVPPAVLTAIIFPEVVLPSGKLNLSLSNARLIAGILAALVAWRTRNVLLTILVGMVCLLILQFLFKEF